MQKIKKNSKKLVEEANAIIKIIKVEDAKKLLKDDTHLFIDIRDYRELIKEGKIPGSISCPRGMLEFWVDPESPYHKKKLDLSKVFILYCASAWRSALATKTLIEMGLDKTLHLEGGFEKWKKSNGPIEVF
ncbi:MAG: rhodanese-like domain-containing protein [Alphaproteobacteria bacterium TMED93]|nr:MAG: rhodanese-like domain-containing protein [Alphaproteobacteria bacterium TMED93]